MPSLITPSLHSLEGMKFQRLKWHDAIAELVDNSLDAGATEITIDVRNRHLIVIDNGCGITDVVKAATVGGREDHTSTQSGRYGVGLKDTWLYLSNRLRIVSRTKATESRIAFDTKKFVQIDGRWMGPDPHVTPNNTGKTGTTIDIGPWYDEDPRRKPPSEECFQSLQKTFTPAVESGACRIDVYIDGKKPVPLKPVKLPEFERGVQSSFVIDGKPVAINIGIVAGECALPLSDFWLISGHRMIEEACYGKGDYEGARVIGTITLGKGWGLTRNKTSVEGIEAVSAEVFRRIEPLLRLSADRSKRLASAELLSHLEQAINQTHAIVADAREKRSPGDSSGSVKPTGAGGPRRNASKVDPTKPGSVTGMADRPSKVIISEHYDQADPQMCRFTPPNKLSLNKAHEAVAWHMATDNRPALEVIALTALAHALDNADGSQLRLVPKGDFMFRFSELCKLSAAAEKAKVKK